MLVAVAGGNLQGVEAAYLSRKAGWDVLVIDRKPMVPATGLCHSFARLDVTSEKDLAQALSGVDLVMPALENDDALACLDRVTRNNGIPFAFDPAAFAISSSKIKSEQLFKQSGAPTPARWPTCKFPAVAKPDRGSGSQGVTIFKDKAALQVSLKPPNPEWLIQEFISGPSYSLEVIGMPGRYTTPQVTDLAIDAQYDCKRVTAPSGLTDALISKFETLSLALAKVLNLKGIMDVEVILDKNDLKVIEIDARLPSQTPTAVYWSTGLNMVHLLGDLFLNRKTHIQPNSNHEYGVIYEHVSVSSNHLEIAGEHIMSGTDALQVYPDFFGADEAITNYQTGRDDWVATLIVVEENIETAWEKRNSVIADIRKILNLEIYRDPVPQDLT
ncbi:MAG: 3-methylornithine--L-lysine ligase PylC [Desulfobacterales bacterium]